MATISTSIRIFDGMSQPLRSMLNASNLLISSFESMQNASGRAVDTATIQAARSEINNASAAYDRMEQEINQVRNSAERTSDSFNGWQKGIIVANQALGLVKSTLSSLGAFSMDNAFSRMDTMSQFQRTVGIMTGNQDAANAALERLKNTTLGTAYGLDVAAKSTQGFLTRGLGLGNATEKVRIWADAVSFYGKGTNEQLENVMDALGKMYSKGKVETTQLDRLTDAGIGAIEIYAQATGKMASQVQSNLSAGKISSVDFINTVSQAMDKGLSAGAAKNAGASWATTFSNLRANITRGWIVVIEKTDQALSKAGLPNTMEMIKQVGTIIEQTISKIGNIASTVAMVFAPIYNNWRYIRPVILGVVAALIAYKGVALSVAAIEAFFNLQKSISNTLSGYQAIRVAAANAALEGQTVATFNQTVAQHGLNAALLACPLTWIIGLIILLVTIIYIAVAAINKWKGTTISATGLIMGAFFVLGAYIYNTFIVPFWNVFARVANFFGNVWHNPIAAVKVAFYDLALDVIGYIQKMASAIQTIINKIPGVKVNITSGLDGFVSKLDAAQKKVKDESGWVEYVKKLDFKGYEDAWSSGNKFGQNIADKLKDTFSNVGGYDDLLNETTDIANNTGKMKDSMEITGEDLKYLRDIAERDVINRFTTAEIKVDMSNTFGDIRETADVDGILNHLTTKIGEQMAVAAEGVHS